MSFEDIATEYRGAPLGDPRRSRRLERIGLDLCRNPGLSFPEAMGTEGQLEGLYRFLNNDQVTFEAVHAPHAEQTRLRCQQQDRVLVLHDTTVLKYNGDRQGLGRIHDPGSACGFRAHVSLAVTPARVPLGVLRVETWARTGPPCSDLTGEPRKNRHVRSAALARNSDGCRHQGAQECRREPRGAGRPNAWALPRSSRGSPRARPGVDGTDHSLRHGRGKAGGEGPYFAGFSRIGGD